LRGEIETHVGEDFNFHVTPALSPEQATKNISTPPAWPISWATEIRFEDRLTAQISISLLPSEWRVTARKKNEMEKGEAARIKPKEVCTSRSQNRSDIKFKYGFHRICIQVLQMI
jgi:hypothetical protein